VGEAASYCGGTPAEAWHGNYVNDTSYRIEAAGLAPGRYTLQVGVRDMATGELLELEGGGEDVRVGEIVVR
jgi:hypothetical protein